MKKTTSTNRRLVLGRENVRLLVELSADRLLGIQAGIQAGMAPYLQCSEPESGCTSVSR